MMTFTHNWLSRSWPLRSDPVIACCNGVESTNIHVWDLIIDIIKKLLYRLGLSHIEGKHPRAQSFFSYLIGDDLGASTFATVHDVLAHLDEPFLAYLLQSSNTLKLQ